MMAIRGCISLLYRAARNMGSLDRVPLAWPRRPQGSRGAILSSTVHIVIGRNETNSQSFVTWRIYLVPSAAPG
jgi:hypothetical protein